MIANYLFEVDTTEPLSWANHNIHAPSRIYKENFKEWRELFERTFLAACPDDSGRALIESMDPSDDGEIIIVYNKGLPEGNVSVYRENTLHLCPPDLVEAVRMRRNLYP